METPRASESSPSRTAAVQWLRTAVVSLVFLAVAVLLVVLDLRVDWQRRRVADLVTGYFDPAWLDRDRQPPGLFDDVLPAFRDTVVAYEAVRGIFVTRAQENGAGERLIYPDQEFARWRAARSSCERVPVRSGQRTLGYLYIDFDPTVSGRLHWLLRGSLAVVLVLGAVVLVLLRRQAHTIESTSVQLAERTQELYHLERLALVGRLAASILHDLKKPLLNIRDDAEQIADPRTRSAIREQVSLFFDILRELDLEGFLARAEDRAEFVDLEEVVGRSYRLVERQGSGIAFHKEFPAEPILVLALKHRLIQVFSNLFLNALQAMPEGGTLSVHGAVDNGEAGREIRVRVEDTGAGIAPERLPRIFEPFQSYSGVAGSTGLGLYITRSLIRDLGGNIAVDSAVGRGTTFTITLPLEEQPSRGAGDGPPAAARGPSRRAPASGPR